jgi:hypothetical protein
VEGQIQEYDAPLSPFVWKCRVFLSAECYDANVRKIFSTQEKKMNTRNLLVSVLILICVLLSACAPAAAVTPIVPTTVLATTVPATEGPDEFALAGDPIPDNLLNVDYFLVDGKPPVVIRLRATEDPQCVGMNAVGNCFTILRADNPADPGARGPAAIVNGQVALKFQIVPYGPDDVGSIEYFEPKEGGGVLAGVKCETKTGAACNADVGTTWKSAPPQTTFHSSENASFRLPLAFSYGPEWGASTHINAIDIIHKGNPPEPQSAWWGGGVILVNGAHVADPAKITDPAQMTTPSLDDFLPLPDDFFAYVASIPGMKVVQSPTSVTIGGVQGLQMIVHTPEVMHTMLWLQDDYTGLGDDYSDRKELLILLAVNGEQVLLGFDDSPDKFDERYPLVQEVFNSITFTK